MSAIEMRGLRKCFGQRVALEGLDLAVGAGEVVALVGENGAGKTTALAMLSGQLVPDAGAALIGGFDVFAEPIAARRLVGYVAQDLLVPPELTIDEMAQFACAVKEAPLSGERLDELLVACALREHRDRLIGELSHGMQRKAAWVVALVSQPAVLVLDEGLAGLDATSGAALIAQVTSAVDAGLAVLWTEHDLGPMIPLIARAVVLHGGRVAEVVAGETLREAAERGELGALMRRFTSAPAS